MAKEEKNEDYMPRWMTECDVIRYNLRIPETLKRKLKKEAQEKGMDSEQLYLRNPWWESQKA
jgi:hypothetical protein